MALASTPSSQLGPEQPPTARIGMVLSGTYRLDAYLGQGMTGLTYNAWHLRQKQPFAVKLLHRELAPSHERVSKLRQDLRVLSSLRRYGFLPVDLSFGPDGSPFLAAELLVGETLRVRLSRGPLPVLAAGIVTAALARALGEAHKQGVVHGDLRPENIFLVRPGAKSSFAGKVVIVEHSLHHLRRRPSGLDDQLPLYKLMYRPPELLAGAQAAALDEITATGKKAAEGANHAREVVTVAQADATRPTVPTTKASAGMPSSARMRARVSSLGLKRSSGMPFGITWINRSGIFSRERAVSAVSSETGTNRVRRSATTRPSAIDFDVSCVTFAPCEVCTIRRTPARRAAGTP